MANNKSRIIATLLLLLFLSFQGGRSLCYHTHIFGDKIIAHSHPFNNPDKQHTSQELTSICQIGLTSMTDDITSVVDILPALDLININNESLVSHTDLGFSRQLCGRAPPVFHTSVI